MSFVYTLRKHRWADKAGLWRGFRSYPERVMRGHLLLVPE